MKVAPISTHDCFLLKTPYRPLSTHEVNERLRPRVSLSLFEYVRLKVSQYQKYISIFAMIMHAVQMIAVIVFVLTMPNLKRGDGEFPVYVPAKHWYQAGLNDTIVFTGTDVSRSYTLERAFSFSIPWSMIFFFAWSFLAMLSYTRCLNSDVRDDHLLLSIRLRYFEYAVSASVMIIAIALEAGVSDLYALLSFAVFIFITNMAGLVADLQFDVSSDASTIWYTQYLAWGTFVSAFSMIMASFYYNISKSILKPPWFVYVVVFQMFVLYAMFGAVQVFDFWHRKSTVWVSVVRTEHLRFVVALYDILSLTAKSNLAWFILIPVITGQI